MKKCRELANSLYLFRNRTKTGNNGTKRISRNYAYEKWQDYRKDVYEQQQHVRVITFHALIILEKERVSFTNPSNNLFTCFFISYYPLLWKKSHSTSVKIKFFSYNVTKSTFKPWPQKPPYITLYTPLPHLSFFMKPDFPKLPEQFSNHRRAIKKILFFITSDDLIANRRPIRRLSLLNNIHT